MARAVNRLSARTVETLRQPGRHADGQGLYLQVDRSGAKRWVFVFQWEGARKEMGLGPLSIVSLAEARNARQEARKHVFHRRNPIEERRRARARNRTPSFGSVFESWMAQNEVSFRNAKHRQQWRNTLSTYASSIWEMPVEQVSTDKILEILKPIWTTKPETASRVRGRIERVLDAARVRGLFDGENPARWKGHLASLLPPPRKLTRGHHAALPYTEAPKFMKTLREVPTASARALEFTILTASRTSETIMAKWSEIDIKARLWTIPAERMKASRIHRVPLSDAALQAIGDAGDADAWIFPGTRLNSHLSAAAMEMLLRRLNHDDITVHGFRSTFRDWAGEATNHPREVIEAALAHVLGDATERAYRRGDAIAKRDLLMQDWAGFLSGATSRRSS